MRQPDQSPIYGWVMVGVSFATEFAASGCMMYAFAVVMSEMADEFSGGDRTPVLAVQMAGALVALPLAPYIGRLVGRGWTRPLMTLGAIAMGLGLLGISRAQDLWQVALCYAALLTLGASMLSGVPTTTIIINWFERRPAVALGITQLGASLSGVVLAPAVASLVQIRGWRGAYEVLGVTVLFLAPVLWMLIRAQPADRGPQPDSDRSKSRGTELTTANAEASPSTPFRTIDALRKPNLWRIGVATGISFMATGTLLSHVVAFGTDAGFSQQRAALLASIIAGGAAIGKLVFGWLSDRFGPATAFMASLSIQAIGFGALIGLDGYGLIVGVLFFAGLGCGGTYPLASALLAQTFGRDEFAPMFGLMLMISSPPGLVGPIMAAAIYDANGNYDLAFAVFVAALFGALFLVRAVRMRVASTAAAL